LPITNTSVLTVWAYKKVQLKTKNNASRVFIIKM